MIIIVINPLLSFGGLEDYMSFDYYYEAVGTSLDKSDKDYYTDLMEMILEDYISSNYDITVKATIEFDTDYNVSCLTLEINDELTESLASEIEADLLTSFNISNIKLVYL